MGNTGDYEGREQTRVKHLVLRGYLRGLTRIVGLGGRFDSITYVDCFSGPWNSRSEDFDDTSFGIAIQELRAARDHLKKEFGRDLSLRCYFLEKDPCAYKKLEAFVDPIKDIDISAHNETLEDSIKDISQFASYRKTFPFILIDPTGWTGFGLDVIQPLLKLSPCEILINFMTEHIRRFINTDVANASFEALFGEPNIFSNLENLSSIERDDAIVSEYVARVREAGDFKFASAAAVLNPLKDRSHFHLIYLTRHPSGIKKFKEVEKKSMKDMEFARAEAMQKERQARTHQGELFTAEEVYDGAYYDKLRKHFMNRAKRELRRNLEDKKRILYDDAWAAALRLPLVWETDVKKWIAEWRADGKLQIDGMTDRQRVPKTGANNTLTWIL